MGARSAYAPSDTVREYRGLYETGFEVSWFHPCGAPAGDDSWWVTLSNDALRQRDSLAKSLTGQPRRCPPVPATWDADRDTCW